MKIPKMNTCVHEKYLSKILIRVSRVVLETLSPLHSANYGCFCRKSIIVRVLGSKKTKKGKRTRIKDPDSNRNRRKEEQRTRKRPGFKQK
jgi:hypothetical protein